MQIKIKGIKLTVEIPQLEEMMVRINEIALDVKSILKKEKQIMGKLEDALGKVQEIKAQVLVLNDALDGTRAIVEQMKTDLAALKSGEVLSDVVAGKVDDIITNADSALAEVKATYDENFPAAPPPPDEV
jgi:chromosome condensin MukBEF ATPase and DNA-binding subunit MukB